MGLALRYVQQTDGSVTASFLGNCALEGYAGLLHGGVIAALLDGAMTNCLFAHGIEAVTAELTVRFLRPVLTDRIAAVNARLSSAFRRLYVLQAELIQDDMEAARAQGKFLRRAPGVPDAALQR